MTFILGTVYEFIHAGITFRMHPEVNGRGVFYARLAIAIASLCALVGGACHCLNRSFEYNGETSKITSIQQNVDYPN